MATPAPIYASSPGLLVSKNPATTQVVLIPPASTIAGQLIVRDASGTASLTNPIVVSTTQGALFTGGASTFYISDPYAAFATASLSPSLYMPLYASSFQPTFRYGTESNFTPQYQYISSAYNPASFQAISSTALYGTLVNGAPLFTTADPAAFRFQAQSLSTGHLSTAELTVAGAHNAATITTTSSYSAYLSAGVGLLSSLTTDSMAVAGRTVLQSTLRTAGSLDVGGNFSMAGPAVFADVSANGYWSTLGTIGIGGDVSGVSFTVGGSVLTGAPTYARDAIYVSSGSVGASLSTILSYASTAVYSAGLGVGVAPGTALGATLDVSGGGAVSGFLTAGGISTFRLSTGTAVISSATLRDINTPYSAYDLKVQGGQLYVGANPVGSGGGVSADFLGNSFTASNYLYGMSSIASTFTVGSTIVNPDFDVAVYGSAHTSTATRSTLMVAVGSASNTAAIVAGYRASIQWSWNGSNWSNALSGGFYRGHDVAWNGRMWVAVGANSNIANQTNPNIYRSTIQWSLDGSNWSNCITGGFPGGGGGIGIAWNGRMWIASGHHQDLTIGATLSTIQWSLDGSNFNSITTGLRFMSTGFGVTGCNATVKCVWNGRYWLGIRQSFGPGGAGFASSIIQSFDGLNWQAYTGPWYAGGMNLGWNGRYWVGVGHNGGGSVTNHYSVNGINWIRATTNFNPLGSGNGYARDVKWNGSYWIAVADSEGSTCNMNRSIRYSYDGLNWNLTVSNQFDPIEGGSVNSLFTQNNGGFYTGVKSVIWTGNLWIAVGGANTTTPLRTIEYSRDGMVWSNIATGGFLSNGVVDRGVGVAIACQSNVEYELSLLQSDVITNGIQQSYQSTSQIYSLSSIVSFNQSLFVESSGITGVNAMFSSTISTQYTLYVDGSMFTYGAAKLGGTASWTAASDERVKEDIQDADLSACYHVVRNLHVHNYKFKDEYVSKYKLPSKPRYGLYAEEVERVLPEAVIDTDILGENIKMLDMEPVYMTHYGATAYLYSTLKHQTSTIAGGHTYITAAGPLNDISGAIYGNPTYSAIPSLIESLADIYAAHQANYQ